MKFLKLFFITFFTTVLVISQALTPPVSSQSGATEAPAGFDNLTNGFTTQAQFDADRAAFEAREEKADGLGPVYNAQSCAECHQNRVTGGVSQIFEVRAGHNAPDGTFVPAAGGSLIQSRSINTTIQERVPGGPRLTYVNNAQQVSYIAFDLDAGRLSNIPNLPATGSFPAFSADGSRIAFSSSGNIWVANNDGTNPNQITFDGTDSTPTWAPDGTKIAFSRIIGGVAQIFTVTTFGTEDTNLSNNPLVNDRMPAFSPNGTKIAFQRTPNAINPVGKIWTMNADGSGQTQVTLGLGTDERPAWSPDAANIAFSTNRDGNFEIYKTPATGGVATRLTNNAASDRNPSWAPDNSAIAFGSNRTGVMNLWAVAPDGTNPTQINGNNDGGGDQPNYTRDQGETIRTLRASPHVLGLGFVEAIADGTLLTIRNNQPLSMRGTAIEVGLTESPDQTRVGRFGWKNSVASLLSFSAGAYLLEMGITSPLLPFEQSSLGRSTAFADTVADPEDTGGDGGLGENVEAFTRFMRSTKVPPRNSAMVLNDATDPGSLLFDSISCSVCHVRSITTAPPGSVINGGTFEVPAALGNKIIHPFSDFLLHDIGTGDGIVETNGELTRNKIRTAPLWGLRTRDRFMHDGGSSSPPTNSGAQSFTLNEAILRHAGQATASKNAYQALTPIQKQQLIRFLKSL
ncbi:MAG TPA: di-heme oxidoredictase family protein [Pyrinomonadaceae bacterium]|nr:di-heme oxidoredictase family protein [Pyrinomonadaceae bacterium]